jgi:hypothetical protein
MIKIEIDDEVENEIKRETKKDERYPNAEIQADGYRRFNGMILVPKKLEEKVIRKHHDNITEGHPGEARTVEKIQRSFYFPGMIRKVRKFVKACDSCQRNKTSHEKAQGKMHKGILPSRPWQHITIDFMSNPQTKNVTSSEQMDQTMVIVDRFSKQAILIPCRKSYNAKEVFHILWERIFAIFGIPDTITSDMDKIFKSQEWRQLMSAMRITLIMSTANHQQTDGQTERKIQEIQALLRHFLDYEQTNWIELLPIVQYAINDAVSSTTKATPNFTVFGTSREHGREQLIDASTPIAERMKTFHENIRTEQLWMQENYKRHYDTKRKEAPDLQKGDRVYLRRRTVGNKEFNIRTNRNSTKLDQLQLGPFTIEEKMKFDNYKLRLPTNMKVHPVFHVSLLIPTGNKETQTNVEATEELYEVERIIDKRTSKGITEYLIKWKGYGDEQNSWEPTNNLNCPEKVREYTERKRNMKFSGRKL